MNRLARAINSIRAWCPKVGRLNVPESGGCLVIFRRIALIMIPLGLFLWFLSMGPVVGRIMASKFLRYATSAVAMLLIASGVALLTASFGRAYLWFFLAFGFLAGAPMSLVAFNAFWIGFAEMIAIGEASVFTILYLALTIGFLYGLAGGILGVVICYVIRRLWRMRKPVNAPANRLPEAR